MDADLVKKAAQYAVVAGICSILSGFMYICHVGVDFGFLGHEQGSERETTGFWAACAISLGIGLIVSAALGRKPSREPLFFACALIVIQLPPLLLWLMFYLMAPWNAGCLQGFFLHVLLLLLLLRCLWAIAVTRHLHMV